MIRPPPTSTLFPYTTLFRSDKTSKPKRRLKTAKVRRLNTRQSPLRPVAALKKAEAKVVVSQAQTMGQYIGDRKSTRLNSSHVEISYAVFCLKKKKATNTRTR